MIKLKEYFNWQILLILFVNIFLANSFFYIKYVMGYPAVWIYGGHKFAFILCLLGMFLCVIRVIYLPILYSLLEKYSKNSVVKKFINKLKTDKIFQIQILVLIELPILYLGITNSFGNNSNIFKSFYEMVFFLLVSAGFIDLFGSYVVLFLWWKFKDELR